MKDLGWCTGLALCLGIASCSSQFGTGEVPSNDIKTTNIKTINIKEIKSMPEKDADLEKEKFMREMVPKRAQTPIDGTLVHYQEFASDLIRPRPVDVWLPEGYDPASSDRYPVIYMHDGQFLFHQSHSPFAGMDLFWDVDKAITRLVRDGEIRPAIVVSVWMSQWTKGARGAEYMPQKPVTDKVWQRMKESGKTYVEDQITSISNSRLGLSQVVVTDIRKLILISASALRYQAPCCFIAPR